jgi:septal ring-binding cell division protein DamX
MDEKLRETVPEKKEVVVKPDRKKKIVVAEPVPVPVKKRESSSRDGDALFNERIKASSTWLGWAYRGGYTIQLMVLVSENAEDNLKKILVDDKYYAIRNQLYILRKTSPKTIFVFYGKYPDMDKARQGRNNMPSFLREIQPYALSIQDAMKKIED